MEHSLGKGLLCLLCLLSSGYSPFLFAKVVETTLPNGVMVTADFRPGKPGMPTVLLVHGFLQTREFQTVSRLADDLALAGFSTLAPTLSLGISRRARSLPCEAIHRHTMEQDVAEIGFWMNWLAQNHPGPVVLIGHSYGSLQSLIYAAGEPAPRLRQMIGLSLVDAERQTDQQSEARLMADVKQRMSRGDKNLISHPLGYCKQYVSTPQSYYSYARWSRSEILRLLRKNKVPLEVIMGGGDDRMGEDWIAKLRTSGNNVRMIPGANHFFDAEHEFDVLDLTISLSKRFVQAPDHAAKN